MECRKRVWGIFLFMFMSAAAGGYAQTETAAGVLGQASPGVLTLIIYGADKAETARCSASVIEPDVVATAYHMIAGAFDADIVNAKGKKFKVEGVLGADKSRDLALLKVKGKFEPLTGGMPESVREGERVFALGSNGAGEVGVSEGALRRHVDLGGGLVIMEFSLNAPDLYQGGPVMNQAGQAVGIFLALNRSIRIGVPFKAAAAVARSSKPAGLKDQPKDEYVRTFEGAALLGLTAYAFNEMALASPAMKRAVELDGSFARGLSVLAALLYRQNDHEGSAAAWTRLSALEPNNAEACYGLGKAEAAMRNFPQAVQAFEKSVELGIQAKDALFEIGSAYEHMEEWARASDAYMKYLTRGPEMAWTTWLRLGACRVKMKEYGAAVAAFTEAEKAQPNDIKIKVSLADVYEQAGELEKAEAIYNALAALNTKDAKRYYMQIIRIYDAAGRQEKTIEAVNRIIALEPDNEANYYNLGLMFFKSEKYAEAIAAFKKSLELKPDNAYAWFQTGSAEFNRKNYKEAIAAYNKYVALKSDDPSGWLGIGVSYMFLKDYEAALEPIRKCVELRPDNGPALFNLGLCYLKLYDEVSARDVQKKLLAVDRSLADKLDKALARP